MRENGKTWYRICKMLCEYKKYFPGIICCLLGSSFITFIHPLLIRQITDCGILQKNMKYILLFSVILIIISLTQQELNIIQTKLFSNVHNQFTHSLYKKTYWKINRMKIQYFAERGSAEIINTIGMDIDNVSSVVDQITQFSISSILQIIGGVVGLSLLDWKLAILIEAIIPLKFIIVSYCANKKREVFEQWIEDKRKFITNMGALMIAKDLKKFESLHRRTVRVIWYKENSRLDAIREKEFCAGYAFSHEEIVQYIMTIIPQEEVIVEATRKSVVSFPEIAIRELLANAMIHQDLQQRGTNPMVEVFKNRIEFSNAGAPLVAIERIVDSVPVSRNENIAGFMHKCGICEERGSGYDKIVEATGKNELLAPRIENQNNQFTKAILFAKVPFELTTKEDRMRTCYMQACLAYVNFEGISNSDIRKIFGLGEKEKAKASRLLTSAVDGGYIKVMDPDTAPRYKKYIPYWA